MSYRSKSRIFEFAHNAAQQIVRLTFEAFSASKPDERPSYTIVGPYCKLRRSPREYLIFKLKSRQMLEALCKARAVHVVETSHDGVVWKYNMERK